MTNLVNTGNISTKHAAKVSSTEYVSIRHSQRIYRAICSVNFLGEWSVSHAARCNWEVLLQADQLNLASYVTCFINLQDQG